jgi:rhodanese-related sulfurtransferase
VDFFVFISEQWLLVSLLLILIYGFAFNERIKGGKPIPAHETTRMVNADEAVLLDVRDSKEFNAGHIAGALNIPASKMDSRISELEKYRSKTLVVADKMGQQAGNVGKKLRNAGFEVRRLQGGMAEWGNQGLPLVKK